MTYYVASEDREEALAADEDRPPRHSRDDCPGWTGLDTEGRPRPCLKCKPWLGRRLRRGQRTPVRASR